MHLSQLYELSLAIGQSTDLYAECEHFLTAFMTVKQLDHSSVWIDQNLLREVDLTTGHSERDAYQEVFTSPRSASAPQHLQLDHPLISEIASAETISSAPPGFQYRDISPAIVPHEGAAACIRLAELGFLIMYSKYHKGPYIDPEFNELRPLIYKFSASLEGCLDHQRLRREIIARKRAETAVRHREEHFRSLIENALDVILIINYDGSISFASPSVKRVLGFDPEDLVGKNLFSLVHPKEATELFRSFQREVMAPGIVSPFQFRFGHRDGSWRTVSASTNNLLSTPSVAGIIMNLNDVTERNRMRKALKRSEERYSLAVRGANDGIWDWNLKTDEIYLSPRWKEMIGYADEEIGNTPQSWFDLVLPQDQPGLKEALDNSQGGENELFQHEYRMRHKDGSIRWMLTRGVAMLGPDCLPYRMAGSQTDITETRRHTAELEEARLRAIEANQAKGEFLANMSHEIRTPMNGVIGMADLLLDRMSQGEEREYVETIKTSGEVLLGVVNDILDFSKIESGRLEIERTDFDLLSCIEGVLDVIGPLAAEKGVRLGSWVAPSAPRFLIGDMTRVRQVLLNLVGNAVKFTPTGSVVVNVRGDVLGEQTGEVEIRFSVEDTGIGIPKEKIHSLFEPFSQADASTTRRFGGTGLGLAISRRLTELMGGRIWVESEEGKGSTFSFSIVCDIEQTTTSFDSLDETIAEKLKGQRVLIVGAEPAIAMTLRNQLDHWGMSSITIDSLAKAAATHAQSSCSIALIDHAVIPADEGSFEWPDDLPSILMAPAGQAQFTEEKKQWSSKVTSPVKQRQLFRALCDAFGAEMPKHDPKVTQAVGPTSETHELKILLAEDNPVNQRVALLMLNRIGLEADVAVNGREVLEAVHKTSYDLILMDIQMPDMDGLEATRCIRESLLDRQPFITAMTAHAMAEDRQRCLTAGMNDYISKPIDLEKLRAAVAAASQNSATTGF